MHSNDQHLDDALGHSEDSIAEIWECLSVVSQRALLRTKDDFAPAPEVNWRRATPSLRSLRDRFDLVEDGFGLWRTTPLGRAVAEYGRKAAT